jgi:hypothetical protein
MREHGISESAAEDKLDSLGKDLGLTVHQTTHVLKVVHSLRWQVHNHIPEHPAHPSEEYAHYPPTELPNGEATPVPGAGPQGDSTAGGAGGQGVGPLPRPPGRVLQLPVRQQAAQHAAKVLDEEAQEQQGSCELKCGVMWECGGPGSNA